MKNAATRAMLIVCLDEDKIRRLHRREMKRGYLIPAWEVLEIFCLTSLKQRFNIPDSSDAASSHDRRLALELEQKGFLKIEVLDGKKDFPEIAATHSFDWNVFHRQGEILWDCGNASGRGGSVAERMRRFQDRE